MQLPPSFLQSLTGIPGFDRQAFEQIHYSGKQVTSIRINPAKWATQNLTYHSSLTTHQKVPWSKWGCYLPQRPSFTFDPHFHAGCYYVQDASSMFLEHALEQTVNLSQPLKVLDLCAAPGGKSTHIQSLISKESLLVSNEIIRSRCAVLIDNITKWGCQNVVITNNDAATFQRLPLFFDVIIIDAPCSGSGLFRKDAAAIEEWSVHNVALCAQRQQRIVADALPALKEGGILIYSTCSYSKEEDENISDWLVEEANIVNVPLKIEAAWGIVESTSLKTASVGYRFFPDKMEGEGFYIACFKKADRSESKKYKRTIPEKATLKEAALTSSWINSGTVACFKLFDKLFALPKSLLDDFAVLKASLNIQYAGVLLGEVFKEKLVPAHALALNSIIADSVPKISLDYKTAIKYLQRAEVGINTTLKSWQVVTYEQHNLGWINALSNRINNYYPKALRILKQHNDSSIEK